MSSPSRIPEPDTKVIKDKPTVDYLMTLVKTLRNMIADLTSQRDALQTQVDAINAILAKHHIT